MPSKNAKSSTRPTIVRTVLFVVYPHIKLLDLVGPLQVFNDALTDNQKPRYRTVVASLDGDLIQSDTGLPVTCESLSDWHQRKVDTLIIVGGSGVFAAMNNTRLISSMTRLTKNARRVGSICTGAFLLATAGLLDGRRATTHWQSVDRLASEFPNVAVETNPIYVKDNNVWTSAGVTAGIDMALAMHSDDHGRKAALGLARTLVAFLVRPGGQSQFSTMLQLQEQDNQGRFDALHQWIHTNLDKELRVEHLASQANMSPRHFSRKYTQETGRTPAKAIEAIRVEAARRMLEDGNLAVNVVARLCGFGDDERMRRAFLRVIQVPPSHYSKTVKPR